MNSIVKVISAELDKMTRRIVKVLRNGKYDYQTAFETSPFGIDANPIPGLRAIYLETVLDGKKVLVGYINQNQKADVGEVRLYSTDSLGIEQTYFWLKKDGTMELGGNADNAVRYTALNTALQQLINAIKIEQGKIQAGIIAGGGTYTPTLVSLDISASKIVQVKTP